MYQGTEKSMHTQNDEWGRKVSFTASEEQMVVNGIEHFELK